jgi:hypothetical protein
MPRPTTGARLYLHQKDRQWLIRDGSITRRTGCGEADRAGAEKALGQHIATKFKPVARENDPTQLSVAEVLTALWTRARSDDERIEPIDGGLQHRHARRMVGSPLPKSTKRRASGTPLTG